MVFDDIRDIPKRYPNIDLALLHLGGTRIMGIMVTMDSKEGLKMFKIIDPKKAIPIHYNDYDVFESPLEDFQREVKESGLENRIRYLYHGESYNFELNKN
jgi:L-ascorbate metabolism protein UlaG (beta-lactamase superfamily)